jgi:phage repressor protein C with HTH and peptisase S24 domain
MSIAALYQKDKQYTRTIFIFLVVYLADKKTDDSGMTREEIRRANTLELARQIGGPAAFGRKMGMSDSQVSQIIGKTPTKNIGNIVAHRIEDRFEKARGWLDKTHADDVIDVDDVNHRGAIKGRRETDSSERVLSIDDDEDDPAVARIRKVKLRLSAGIIGFATEPEHEDGNPIYFRRDWLAQRGYRPENLIAIRVKGESMEPNLYAGDTVVINTADASPKDGEVFAVNYEGEDVVKRLMRDAGKWWLASDNPDGRRFPRKECSGDMCLIVGKVVHKQSERI